MIFLFFFKSLCHQRKEDGLQHVDGGEEPVCCVQPHPGRRMGGRGLMRVGLSFPAGSPVRAKFTQAGNTMGSRASRSNSPLHSYTDLQHTGTGCWRYWATGGGRGLPCRRMLPCRRTLPAIGESVVCLRRKYVAISSFSSSYEGLRPWRG